MVRKYLFAVALFWATLAGFLAPVGAVVLNTGSTGGGQPLSAIQPSLALTPLVRVAGPFDRLGEIRYSGASAFRAPPGWRVADGTRLPINQNEALFSKIGTIYGGDGRTNFALPDLRGRVAMGDGNGPGLAPLRIGERRGTETVTLPLPRHNHPVLTPPFRQTSDTGSTFPSRSKQQPTLGLNYTLPLRGSFPRPADDGPVQPDPTLGFVDLFATQFFFDDNITSADGQLLSINQNIELFHLFGSTYGGDGRTTFALPDLRGRIVVGEGRGAGLTERRLGQRFGEEDHVVSTATMPVHEHDLSPLDPFAPDVTGSAGGGQPLQNVQPSLALQYLIAINALPPDFAPDDMPFLGEIRPFAGTFVPDGWMLADGSVLPESQHQELFAMFGTTFGGDGRTTFGLPDLRGRAIVGAGEGLGLRDWRLGETFGTELVSMSLANMPGHDHTYESIPEPGTLGLFGLGLAALGLTRRRRAV